MIENIHVNDIITFTVTTRGSGRRRITRKVVEVDEFWGIGVFYDGWKPFWVGMCKGDRIHKVRRSK